MKSYEKRRKYRITITVLLFAFLISTAILYVMVETDFIFKEQPSMWRILLFIGIVIMVIGAAITAILSKHTLRSVNNVINQMSRLASGDFSARLKHGRFIAIHPIFVEVAERFKKMAEELENSDFVNNFSHEFKKTIVSIAGFAKQLKKDNLTNVTQFNLSEQIRNCVFNY